MIDLYTFSTSNGQRAAIILAECDLPYRVHWVDLMKGEQNAPDFLKVNPAGATPVIVVDPDGAGGKPLTLKQFGAILTPTRASPAATTSPTNCRSPILRCIRCAPCVRHSPTRPVGCLI
jgi:hypothetical protein